MRALLVSTYELGRQPFGLASPAAWLRDAGCHVDCVDLSRTKLEEAVVRAADLVAFYLPMHTATRLAIPVIRRVREQQPAAHLCAYGLYAPLNATLLGELGIATILGGEFEADLVALVRRLQGAETAGVAGTPAGAGLPRLAFRVPDRRDLPELGRYATLQTGETGRRVVGYTEASRGCRHLCRHCPVVPVYQGRFRLVPREVVLADIAQQVAAGAQHVTFGDPDFFNGIGHAVPLVQALAREFPGLTYDVTIKVEHLLKHAGHLATLRDTGCLFVTTAVESLDDRLLALLEKGHTRADVERVVRLCRNTGLGLSPTFVPFTPWTSLDGYLDLLDSLAALELVEQVAPIQLAIRLLVPEGSRLVEVEEVRTLLGPFDPATLAYPWRHPDARVDALQARVSTLVGVRAAASRSQTFEAVRAEAWGMAGRQGAPRTRPAAVPGRRSPISTNPGTVERNLRQSRWLWSDAFNPVSRVLLLATTTGYQTRAFGDAAVRLGLDLVFATDRCHALDDPWRDGAIPVRFHEEDASVDAILRAARERPLRGILAVGDRPVVLAARAAAALDLPWHPPAAAAAASNKHLTRARLAAAGLPVAPHVIVPLDGEIETLLDVVPLPCVVKPLALSGSRGVIRADTTAGLAAAVARVRALLASPEVRAMRDPANQFVAVQQFIPGREFALEGVMEDGRLHTLALFDKPDPLDGPFFEETIYLTPSREPAARQAAIVQAIAEAAAALGLRHGPVHAECRVNDKGIFVLETAARPIGGLCARVLRLVPGAGEAVAPASLEELLLRQAAGESVEGWRLAPGASGVMMIPIPAAGVYRGVDGVEDARAVPGIADLIVTARPEQRLVPLPEGGSYLGFIFAHGVHPADVEASLRQAHARLRVRVDTRTPVADLP